MLRGVALLLLLVNALLLAWALGALEPWLVPPAQRDRDPGRMGQQVQPQTVELLPLAASPAAAASPAMQVPPPQQGDAVAPTGPVSSAASQPSAPSPPSASSAPAR